MTQSPIGDLLVEAEKKAKAKKGTKAKPVAQAHTSTAPCGCQVTVSWFTQNSRTNKIERCTQHTTQKEP